MDKYTIAHIVNANISRALTELHNENYFDERVFDMIKGLRIKNVYDGKFEEGITFENGYTVKECLIPIVKRESKNDNNNK